MQALVVDDSVVTRLVLGHILKSLGFEVIEASDGREGLAQLKRSRETGSGSRQLVYAGDERLGVRPGSA